MRQPKLHPFFSRPFYLLTALFLLSAGHAFAQLPGLAWVQQASGHYGTNETAYAISHDSQGNSYVVGTYEYNITFDSLTLTTGSPSFNFHQGSFITKYNNAGQVVWAEKITGAFARAVVTDSSGNSFVAGTMGTVAIFDTITPTVVGSGDTFLAKYDSAGNVLWVQNMGGAGVATPFDIALDANGNLYLTGQFYDVVTLGSATLTGTPSAPEIFVAKLDSLGTVVWAKQAGGPEHDNGQEIAVDASGNCYIAGFTRGTSYFDNNFSYNSPGGSDAFIAKYDPAGNIIWLRKEGGWQDEVAYGLAVDASGNSYLAGFFNGTGTYGSNLFSTNGINDGFLIKYDASGTPAWSKQIGYSGFDHIYDIALDDNGNIYSTGDFQDYAYFGTTVLTGTGGYDAFICKHDSAGNLILAQNAVGGAALNSGSNITIDNAGAIHLAGRNIGLSTIGSTTLPGDASNNLFVARYATTTGNAVWAAAPYGFSTTDVGNAIVNDSLGNSYVTGRFTGTMSLGNQVLTANNSSADIFVAKLDSTGTVLWAKTAGGTATDEARSIALDIAGNVYITGFFEGSAIFGVTTLSTSGQYDGFIAKYDAAGNLLWAKKSGGTGVDINYGLVVDASGDILTTGIFQGTATFGNLTLTSAGFYDLFVVKYNPSGDVLWAQRAGGTASETGLSMAADVNGNTYVTGSFGGSVAFGNTTLTSAGNADFFVAKYNASGNVVWAKQGGGPNSDQGTDILVDAGGNVLVTGNFINYASFDTTTLTSNGGLDIFLVRYDTAGNRLWAVGAGGPEYDISYGLALEPATQTYYLTGGFSDTASFGNITLFSKGNTDIFICSYDSMGNALDGISEGGIANDFSYSIAINQAGLVNLVGSFQESVTIDSTTLTSSGFEMFIAGFRMDSATVTTPEINIRGNISLYPNPFGSEIFIQFISAATATEAVLTDILGRQVYRKTYLTQTGETTLQIRSETQLPQGMYLLQVKQGDQTQTIRVIKQ